MSAPYGATEYQYSFSPYKPLADDRNVGLCEVATLEQQWFAARLGQRVGEAISVVEAGSMATLGKLPVRMACELGLFGVDGDDLDVCFLEQPIQLTPTDFSDSCL